MTATGEPSDPEGGFAFEHARFSADWAAVGLAAVGVNAADATNGGPSLQDFLGAEYGNPAGDLRARRPNPRRKNGGGWR